MESFAALKQKKVDGPFLKRMGRKSKSKNKSKSGIDVLVQKLAKRRKGLEETTTTHRKWDWLVGDGHILEPISSFVRSQSSMWYTNGVIESDGSGGQNSSEHPSILADLSATLVQLKRNLYPAAVAHATALNRVLANARFAEDCAPTTADRSFQLARIIANPFDVLSTRKGVNKVFVNRSAIKLANIDAILDLSLTSLGDSSAGFKFVDLCGAPGGFSEYLLWRCSSLRVPRNAFGWGMSLCGSNSEGTGCEWKLQHMMINVLNNSNENSVMFRCCKGADSTGDIYNEDNVKHLMRMVESDSSKWHAQSLLEKMNKVHLVVCDGGFDAQRDSEDQEASALRLVASQISTALGLIQVGGTVILKFFGSSLPQTKQIIHLASSHFLRTLIIKPVSSRPASAERYVVFENLLSLGSERVSGKVVGSVKVMSKERQYDNARTST